MGVVWRILQGSWGYLSAFFLGQQTVEKEESNPSGGFFTIKGWMIFGVVVVLIVWIMRAMKWTIPNPFIKKRRVRRRTGRISRIRTRFRNYRERRRVSRRRRRSTLPMAYR